VKAALPAGLNDGPQTCDNQFDYPKGTNAMQEPPRKVTLNTIAARMKLSAGLVSRALRNDETVSADKRARIFAMAQALGYRSTNRLNNAHLTKPSNIMVLSQCAQSLNDQGYLRGISRVSIQLNQTVLFHIVPLNESQAILAPLSQPVAMSRGIVDGIVLIHHWPDTVVGELASRWPTVSIVHEYPDTRIDHVGINDRIGMQQVVRHLADGGYRRIGFFGFCPEVSWSRSRYSAYVGALALEQLQFEPANAVAITPGEALDESAFASGIWAKAVMERFRCGVNAWVCPSAGTAQSLCRFFLEQGLKIPGDVAVTGYHNPLTAVAGLPAITGTVLPDEELGAEAMRRLMHCIHHPEESPRSFLIPPRLVVGATTHRTARISEPDAKMPGVHLLNGNGETVPHVPAEVQECVALMRR
jgi:DNA-binding LacI/PurR family transcriptional regulator